jgi:O-antigen ligase
VAARSRVEPIVAFDGTAGVRPVDDVSSGFGGGFLVLCLLTFVVFGRPQDYVTALVPLRLALVLTTVTLVLSLLGPGPTLRELFAIRETKLYFLFYAAMVAGIPFSYYRPGTFEAVILEFPVNLLFFVLLVFHVDSMAKLKRLGVVLVMATCFFTVLTMQFGQFGGGRFFLKTHMFDPNDIAYVELSLLGFALWMLVGQFGLVIRIIAVVSILGGTLLTLYTASRGGFLGLLTFLGLFLCLRVGKVRKSFKAVMAVAIVVAAVANVDKINTDRFMTITSLEGDYNFAEGGRADLWTRGWRLFLRHPLTGVGVNGFAPAIGRMRVEENSSLRKWQVAHSAYITVLTETGIIGSVSFLLLVLGCLKTFNRLRRPSASQPDHDLASLAGLLLMGFAAQLVAALFLTQAYSTFFTLAFALSAILRRIAATPAAPPSAAPALPRAWSRPAGPTLPTKPAWNQR